MVSKATGATVDIGKPSEPVTFVKPGGTGWLASWRPVIAKGVPFLLMTLNLFVFARARHSAAEWRFATDAVWGKTALAPLMLLLRHWRRAQLWLLDLYVRERRGALPAKPPPFLSLPLTGPDGVVADSDAVLGRLGSTRRLWVQGGTGMGKTAIFLHLVQTHFGGIDATSLTIFRRDGYVLVPIEARRFPEAPLDEKGASAWVVACVLSVLSERGLSFEDRGLLRAMLNKGTLAIAIDGLSEVARGPAVAAFAAEYPATAIFITSQESGELPFEVWRLPRTMPSISTDCSRFIWVSSKAKPWRNACEKRASSNTCAQAMMFDLLVSLLKLMLIATSYQTIVWDSIVRPSWRDGRRATTVWTFCRQPPGSFVPNEDRTKTNGDSNPMTMRQKTCSNNSKLCASDRAAASA